MRYFLDRVETLPVLLARSMLLTCLLSGEIFAQYHAENWTSESGLPQNSVKAILQTRDGYLWFATNDGLARFNGITFTTFDSSNTPGLCCNRLTALFEDRDGALWIGNDENRIIKYQDGRFSTFITNDENPLDGTRSIKEVGAGILSVVTNSKVLRGKPGEFSVIHPLPAYHFLDRSGADWFCEDRQLIRMKDGRRSVYQFPSDVKGVETVHEDQGGALWIGTEDGLWTLRDGVLTRVALSGRRQGIRVTAIREGNESGLWIGTDRGLYHGPPGEFKLLDSVEGLSNNHVLSLFVDREGLLWVGTKDQGLIKLNKTVITTYSQRDGLAADNVYALFQDSRGRVWVGTWPEEITLYQNGKFEKLKAPNGESFGLSYAIGEDKEGRVWVVSGKSYNYKLWSYEDGRFTDVSGRIPSQAGEIHAIIQDRSGAMWFGSNRGLVRLHRGEATLYTKRDGLADDEIIVLLEDRAGAIWVGAKGGLSRFSNGTFTTYTTSNGFKSDHVRALHEDEEGAIWVGFFDGGLGRIKDERITTITTAEGLFCKGAFQIFDDDRGNFWLGCNSGIYRVSKSQLRDFAEGKLNTIISVPYGRDDGMRNSECNGGIQPAGFKDRDGNLWFPTAGGVAVVDVAKALAKPLPPALAVNQIVVADQRQNTKGPVLINHGGDNLEIHYNSLTFAKPEAVNFYYMMEGLDRNWIHAGNRRVASYPYLPPGQFRFRLAASIDGGEWKELENGIRITVRTPFWKTWWFIGLFVLKTILIGYLFYQRRISVLLRRAVEQREFARRLIESQENERRKVARELHDDVVNDLASLAVSVFNLNRQAPQPSPHFSESMIAIHDRAMSLTENVRNISHSLHPAALQHLGLPSAIRAICDEFTAKEKIPVELFLDHSPDPLGAEVEICIYRIVQESLRNVAKHARANSVLISLRDSAGNVELIVSDDGVGFDVEGVKSSGGLGLLNLKERAGLLGGELRITSAVGQGVEIIASIPRRAKG